MAEVPKTGRGIELWEAVATQHVAEEKLKANQGATAKLDNNSAVDMLGYSSTKTETPPTKE